MFREPSVGPCGQTYFRYRILYLTCTLNFLIYSCRHSYSFNGNVKGDSTTLRFNPQVTYKFLTYSLYIRSKINE